MLPSTKPVIHLLSGAEEKEIHPKVLQKMYRHESVLTTMKYQSNFSFKKADEAIDAVLDF